MVTFPDVKGKNKVFLFFPKLLPDESDTNDDLWTPISVVTLAGHLMQQGFSVEIYDSRTRNDYKAILSRNVDDLLCVGVSAMAGYQVVDGYDFSKYVKAHFPHIPIIWGGWFPTVTPLICLESPSIDIVVKGQGEELLPEIATKLKTLMPVDATTGISYKDNGEIKHNPMRPLMDPNDFLPINYDLLKTSDYGLSKGALHYVSSIGCPYSCTFCGVSAFLKRKWYGLKPTRIVNEIIELHVKYHLKEIIFFDSTFFVDFKRVKEILRGFVREHTTFKWSGNSYVNQVVKFDEEMLELLQATHCSCLELGIESGSRRMRKIFNKDFSDDGIANALQKLATARISVRANYIISPPRETKSDFMATVHSMRNVKEANPDNKLVMYQYLPAPGTELLKYEKKKDDNPLNSISNWRLYHSKLTYDLTAPWLAKKDEFGRQPALFYLKLAYIELSRYSRLIRFPIRILKSLAGYRLKHDIFVFPFEWHLFKAVGSNPMT